LYSSVLRPGKSGKNQAGQTILACGLGSGRLYFEALRATLSGERVSIFSEKVRKAGRPRSAHKLPIRSTQPEPWLRGTLRELPAAHRAVMHALQLAEEDLISCCGDLGAEEWNARPGGIAPLA